MLSNYFSKKHASYFMILYSEKIITSSKLFFLIPVTYTVLIYIERDMQFKT